MQVLGLVWGIFAIIGMGIAFFPCLGSLNWLNIPFSGIGLVLNVIALATAGDKPKGNAIGGVVLCAVAVVFGLIRLVAGGGIV